MQVYIKNNKSPLPTWLKGMVSVVYADTSSNSLFSEMLMGVIYHRRTRTGRRQQAGHNHWDLFGCEPVDGYRFREVPGDTDACLTLGLTLGRRDGRDIGVVAERMVEPALRLPNGFELDATWQMVQVRAVTIYPDFSDVLDAMAATPFHQPGGEGSQLETFSEEELRRMHAREVISQFCLDYHELRARPDGPAINWNGHMLLRRMRAVSGDESLSGREIEFANCVQNYAEHGLRSRHWCDKFRIPLTARTVERWQLDCWDVDLFGRHGGDKAVRLIEDVRRPVDAESTDDYLATELRSVGSGVSLAGWRDALNG